MIQDGTARSTTRVVRFALIDGRSDCRRARVPQTCSGEAASLYEENGEDQAEKAEFLRAPAPRAHFGGH